MQAQSDRHYFNIRCTQYSLLFYTDTDKAVLKDFRWSRLCVCEHFIDSTEALPLLPLQTTI